MSATTRNTARRNRRRTEERPITAPTHVERDVDLRVWAQLQRAAQGAQMRARS